MNEVKSFPLQDLNRSLESGTRYVKMKWWHCVIIFFVANILSVIPAGYNGDEAFYNSFSQPSVAPPDWLFAPMWFFLNITSLFGLFTISNLPEGTLHRKSIIVLEYVAWGLYAIFAFLYFYLKSPILATVNTVLGLIIILTVVSLTYKISKRSFWCFVPRLLWLLLASYVSIWIALHNKDQFFDIGPFIK